MADSDLLLLGGPRSSEIYLAFGPLPEAPQVSRAILVLAPHDTWTPPTSDAEISVFTTRRFRGEDLTRRDAPRRTRTPASRVGLGAGATREIRIDLTDEVAQARARGVRVVSLAIAGGTVEEGAPLRLASPRALSTEKRPRLELSVR